MEEKAIFLQNINLYLDDNDSDDWELYRITNRKAYEDLVLKYKDHLKLNMQDKYNSDCEIYGVRISSTRGLDIREVDDLCQECFDLWTSYEESAKDLRDIYGILSAYEENYEENY